MTQQIDIDQLRADIVRLKYLAVGTADAELLASTEQLDTRLKQMQQTEKDRRRDGMAPCP